MKEKNQSKTHRFIVHMKKFCSMTVLSMIISTLGYAIALAHGNDVGVGNSKEVKISANMTLTVEELKTPPPGSNGQGHIKKGAIIDIKESGKKVVRLQFTNTSPFGGDTHIFEDVSEGTRTTVGKLTLIPINAVQKCTDQTNEHRLDATLVKFNKNYVAIDYNYSDAKSGDGDCENPDEGHGRGGGGGW